MKYFARSKGYHVRWLFQSFLVLIIMLFFLYMIGDVAGRSEIIGAIGETSLGSTAFLVFVAPNSLMASNRRMIGGYVVAAILGTIGFFIAHHVVALRVEIGPEYLNMLCGAGAAVLAMMFMTLFHLEHPPAVGLSLGMALEFWEFRILVVVFVTLILITILRFLFRRWLVDLL